MRKLRLLLLFVFPLAVCTDTNAVLFPHKAVTNTFSYTNVVTNIHTVTQVNYHFTTTNQFDGYVLLSRRPGQEWGIVGGSPKPFTNWVIGTQSTEEYQIILLNRPEPRQNLRGN